MPTKKYTRKLTRTGRGRTITVAIPADIVRQFKWRERQKVVVSRRGKGVLIVDWTCPPKRRKK